MKTITWTDLSRFPARSEEIWQGKIVRLPAWLPDDDGRPVRACIGMWAETRSGYVHAGDPGRTIDLTCDRLSEPFLELVARVGHRPGRLQVLDKEVAAGLRERLTGAGIEVEVAADLPALREPEEGLLATMNKRESDVPGFLEGAGVTLAQVRRFAEAATEFYRAAPW